MGLKENLVAFIRDGVTQSEHKHFFREPLVRFAAADDPLFLQIPDIVGKQHLQPKDLLADAQSVMVFFLPFASWIVTANRESDAVAPEWPQAYVTTNKLLNALSEGLLAYLKEQNIAAEMVRATHTFDTQTLLAPWSHRSAAFVAGMGHFGKNRMLITERGGAGRYGSIVLSEKIAPDPRTEKNRCSTLNGGNCSYCIDHCPVGALSVEGFDRHRCYKQLLQVGEGFRHLGTADCCGKCVVGPCAIFEG